MKSCSNWLDAITECALGKTPEPDLSAHLEICPRCQDALRVSREMSARIEGALHSSAAVEPPLYGPERVIARIRGQTDTRAWWRWVAVASAVLAVLIAIVMWVRRPVPHVDIAALSMWRSPTEVLLRPPLASAWITTPRLGNGFFKITRSGEINAQ
jgi:anti-sigma factor RsiW